jgi:hypothetical protein
MRFQGHFVKAVALFVVFLGIVASAGAATVPVRGASGYGAGTTYSACLTGDTSVTLGDSCEAFGLTPTVVSFNGLNYNVFQFVFGDGTDPGTVLNLLDVGSIAPSTTFTLPPAFFDPLLTQVFACDASGTPDGSTAAMDSNGNTMTGPCTPLSSTSAYDITQSGGSFTTGSDFNVFNLVLDSPAPVSAPEPGSLMLLGVGLLAVGRKLRRVS